MVDAAPELRLLPAGPSHRELVRRLSAVVFARFGDYDVMLPETMRLPWARTVVASLGGREVGFAIYSLEGLARGEVELTAIAVEPDCHSRGIGRSLLAFVERTTLALTPGVERPSVRLTVAHDNGRARRLFHRAGYRFVRGKQAFYAGGQRALTLRKVLERPPSRVG